MPEGAVDTHLGDFELGDVLGRGGSATVYRARHRTLDAIVALKRWDEVVSAGERTRFLGECQLQWRLSEHSNIVRLYWARAPRDEPPWLAMELYEMSLADRLRAGADLSMAERFAIAEELLAGLAAIHDLGHLHRDVKPGNVLLKDGRAALGDLGIAMRAGGWTERSAAGTPGYLAPELLGGATPDARSDVYSAALTIDRLFDDDRPVWLANLLVRATSQSPRDRPANAGDFLSRFRTGQGSLTPVSVTGPDGSSRQRSWSSPEVWNVPLRSAQFIGRKAVLEEIRRTVALGPVSVHALHGLGGAGKTLLVVEFAHRHAADYDIVWWVDAEIPSLIGQQVAALAQALRLVEPDAGVQSAAEAVRSHLRRHGRWLIILDNAEDPVAVRPWLPDGPGHVLITSRNPAWSGVARPLPVDVFSREESVGLLREQVPRLRPEDADQIAEELGDLPLAVSQAAGMLAETGASVAEYLQALRDETTELLEESVPATYRMSVAASVRVALDGLLRANPRAMRLLAICAFLAPEAVPLGWFQAAGPDLWPIPAPAPSPLALRRLTAELARRGLVRSTERGPLLHRVTAALMRDWLSPTDRAELQDAADALLLAATPPGVDDPVNWPAWAELTPHLLALQPQRSDNPGLRQLACTVAEYIFYRGDLNTTLELGTTLHAAWSDRLGPDDYHTLWAANICGAALRDLGRFVEAYDVDLDTLERMRRVFGDDHPDTLLVAGNVALVLRQLGRMGEALELDRDTLERRYRTLGEDHPDSMLSANNLAFALRENQQLDEAHTLSADVLERRRRVSGDLHPQTLISAGNHATVLYSLGRLTDAHQLDEETHERRLQVLGAEHPDTLVGATNLARDLRALGKHEEALDLDQDTLARRRRVLGPDNPDTRISETNVELDRRLLVERGAAAASAPSGTGPDRSLPS